MKAIELPLNKFCSIARSLELVGQKWNLLILREAMFGRTRYADFLRIGVATDVLAGRLDTLVENGLLERKPYREPGERPRDEYVLTDAGRDLMPIFAAFVAWGDRHLPTAKGPSAAFVDQVTGKPVTLVFADGDGEHVALSHIHPVQGLGASGMSS